MGVYQEASIYITIPASAVEPIAAAILAKHHWVHPELEAALKRDPQGAVAAFIVDTEGGLGSDPDWTVNPDDGSIEIVAFVDGKLSFDAEEVEALYALHGTTGTIDGVCEGDKYRARLIGGEVLRSGGETFYTDDTHDPSSAAVDAALKFVRGQISELDVVTVLSRARAAYQ